MSDLIGFARKLVAPSAPQIIQPAGFSRRGVLAGLGALMAAPVIVRASSLMDLRGAPMVIAGAPMPYLPCDGAEYPSAQYPDLFAQIGTRYGGSADGSTFCTPVFDGLFQIGDGVNRYEIGARGDLQAVGLDGSRIKISDDARDDRRDWSQPMHSYGTHEDD